MSSTVQQFQIAFNAQQDRLVLVLTTSDFCEYRFWLTRRIVIGFEQMLHKLQGIILKEEEVQLKEQQIQTSKQIQHEFVKPEAVKYTTKITQYPLGEEPLLLYQFSSRINEQDQLFFHFEDAKGVGLDFAGDGILATVLSELLRKALAQADWGI